MLSFQCKKKKKTTKGKKYFVQYLFACLLWLCCVFRYLTVYRIFAPWAVYVPCFALQAETKREKAAASAAEAESSGGGGGRGGGRRSPECQETSAQRGDALLTEAGGGLLLRRPHAGQGKHRWERLRMDTMCILRRVLALLTDVLVVSSGRPEASQTDPAVLCHE